MIWYVRFYNDVHFEIWLQSYSTRIFSAWWHLLNILFSYNVLLKVALSLVESRVGCIMQIICGITTFQLHRKGFWGYYTKSFALTAKVVSWPLSQPRSHSIFCTMVGHMQPTLVITKRFSSIAYWLQTSWANSYKYEASMI